MSDATEAASIAATLFDAGQSVNEVIAALTEVFDAYRFYEAGGRLYMEGDAVYTRPFLVCQVPEGVPTK